MAARFLVVCDRVELALRWLQLQQPATFATPWVHVFFPEWRNDCSKRDND
jgi:hypothetical protein